MRLAEVRNIIHQVIAEVKKEKTEAKKKPKTEKKPEAKSKIGSNLPKSSGKLADLKKEMEGLKRMEESLGQLQITEGDDGFVAEYAHMQSYVNELNSIKEAHANLSEKISKRMEEVKMKMQTETAKVKEMMGLGDKSKMKDEAKKTKKVAKDEVNEEMDLGSNLRSLSSKIKDAFEKGDKITVNGKKITKVYGGELTTEEGKKLDLSELPNGTDIKIDGQKIKFDFKKNKEDQATDIRNSKAPLDESSFSSVGAMLKAARAAILAGETVTADGMVVSQVIIPLGKFKLVNGTTLSFTDAEEIAINGEPIELELSEPKPYVDTRTQDQKDYDAAKFQSRFGPGGGYQTSRGFYTGD
jgi:hypothetical protein